MTHHLKTAFAATICFAFLMIPSSAKAQFNISFDLSDFSSFENFEPGNFGTLQTFDYNINFNGPLTADTAYSTDSLNNVTYNIVGAPGIGSPTFNFNNDALIGISRPNLSNPQFAAQGGSLDFTVSSTANLADGLQASELVADANGRIFSFDAEEDGTGTFHAPLLELFADGTAILQNAANNGGSNAFNGQVPNLTEGEEFVFNLDFTPGTFTLAGPVASVGAAVPEPSSMAFLMFAGLAGLTRRRK